MVPKSSVGHVRQKRGAAARAAQERENVIRERERARQREIEAKNAADLAAQKAEKDRIVAEQERRRQLTIEKEAAEIAARTREAERH
jgi:hypothetical protein